MNRQCQRFVVVHNPDMVKKLSAMNAGVMGMDGDPFYGAPDVIVVLADKSSATYYMTAALLWAICSTRPTPWDWARGGFTGPKKFLTVRKEKRS